MKVDVEQMESWIGADVFSVGGEKVGKVEDVYFVGSDPIAIAISSGLGGRKHHAAALKNATVTHDEVRLRVAGEELVKTEGGALTADHISALAAHDDRLAHMRPDDIEGARERDERLAQAAQAREVAEKLEAEARARGEKETKAVSDAEDAASAAEAAGRDRAEAETRASEARAAAEGLAADRPVTDG